MNYSTHVYTNTEIDTHHDDIEAYYEIRKKAYNRKWGSPHYDHYPTSHDAQKDTLFVILKSHDADSGEERVIGGQRIVFPDPNHPGMLPVESLHKIIKRTSADKFVPLRGKEHLALDHIVPAVQKDPKPTVAELGAFAIDQDFTAHMQKDEYTKMREAMYAACLEAAKAAGADISLMAANRTNRKNHIDWLCREKNYPFVSLGRTRELFSNPAPEGEETEILLINLSNRYSFKGAGGILRYNQDEAHAARGRG